MKTITYNKLVRDRIPEIIEDSGKTCEIEVLDDKTYLEMLDKKLTEELNEYYESHNAEELADLLGFYNKCWGERSHSNIFLIITKKREA